MTPDALDLSIMIRNNIDNKGSAPFSAMITGPLGVIRTTLRPRSDVDSWPNSDPAQCPLPGGLRVSLFILQASLRLDRYPAPIAD